jgi:hypothetical protein
MVSIMKRRRRQAKEAKENPSTATVVAIGGGIALLSVAAYFLFKSNAPTATAPPVAAASPAPQLPPNLGDPNDPNSVAYSCAAAWRLNRLGHPHEAAVWIQRCTAGGGTVPT